VQFGITDDVEEQNMPNLKFSIGGNLSRHGLPSLLSALLVDDETELCQVWTGRMSLEIVIRFRAPTEFFYFGESPKRARESAAHAGQTVRSPIREIRLIRGCFL
jgi:hypothetical protein